MAKIKRNNNQITIELDPGNSLYMALCVTASNEPRLIVAEAVGVKELADALVEQGLTVAPDSITDIPETLDFMSNDVAWWMIDNPRQTH